MIRYVLQRLIFIFLTLLVVSFIAFALLSVWPVKVTDQLLRQGQAQIIEKYGLGDPFWAQYVKWLRSCAEFQCGVYLGTGSGAAEPVITHLFGTCLFGLRCYTSSTLLLLGVTFLLTWLLALPLGIYSATHKSLRRERAIAFLGYLWLGLPSFLLAVFVSWFVYRGFNITLTPGGDYSKFLRFLVVYALIVGMANVAVILRHARSSLLDILGSDYIHAARAKGLSERSIIYKHAFKNALNPLISLFGSYLPMLFEGTLVTAFIFNLPVVELQYWQAFSGGQPYMVASGLLFFSLLLLIGNFFADLLLLWSNPRIRYD